PILTQLPRRIPHSIRTSSLSPHDDYLPPFFFFYDPGHLGDLHSFPTRRSSDLNSPSGKAGGQSLERVQPSRGRATAPTAAWPSMARATCTAQSSRRSANSRVPSSGSTIHTRRADSRAGSSADSRSEEHTSELQS